jgi:rSAM/selenodomain-associated transferase 1
MIRQVNPHPTTPAPDQPSARVVLFARAPVLGQVKSRLAAEIGAADALAVYRTLGATIVRALADAPHFDLRVAFTPAGDEPLVRAWLPEARSLVPQIEGDLGARLEGEVTHAFNDGCPSVILVGTDCLAVDAARIDEAFSALDHADAVLGPALDGGYYLLGLARPLAVFGGVPWGTERVAEITRVRFRALGARWSELPVERDVDTLEDLLAVRATGARL